MNPKILQAASAKKRVDSAEAALKRAQKELDDILNTLSDEDLAEYLHRVNV